MEGLLPFIFNVKRSILIINLNIFFKDLSFFFTDIRSICVIMFFMELFERVSPFPLEMNLDTPQTEVRIWTPRRQRLEFAEEFAVFCSQGVE